MVSHDSEVEAQLCGAHNLHSYNSSVNEHGHQHDIGGAEESKLDVTGSLPIGGYRTGDDLAALIRDW